MARIVVFFKFADGDNIQVIADGKPSYPDALAQLRSEAVTAFKESLAYTLALQAPKVETPIEDES